MIEKYLAEVETREKATTEGPWKIDGIPRVGHVGPTSDIGKEIFDDIFISYAKTDIPRLLRIVKRLRGEMEYFVATHPVYRKNVDEALAYDGKKT